MAWLFQVIHDFTLRTLKANLSDPPLPLPPVITCRIHYSALLQDLVVYKLSTEYKVLL